MSDRSIQNLVVLEKHPGFAVIRWNRPHRKNAIIQEMENSAVEYLNKLAADDEVSLVVLTGTGEYYTSGADFLMSMSNNDSQFNRDTAAQNLQPFKNFVDCLIKFPKPIVVAVNGPAIGMGVSTLPLCDVVYASADSTFLTPFSRIGMVPEACSSHTFPRIMGYAKANEMLLFNRTLSASEAYNCGLVADVFPKETLMKEVYKRVHEFLDNPAKCLLSGKQLIRERDREKLLHVNKEEVERLVERALSEDTKMQAMKFVKRRMELKQRRNAKL